jgi:membrane protease YdiL (CAAX protease family)
MDGVRLRYERMFRNLRLNWSEIAFISLCAGVGEELLFRGVLQPLLGIVLTAVLFVAIHGYLNPRDWRISVYGVFMTGVICFLGWMTEVYGIWSAVMAHFVIDVILLADLLEKPNETPNLPSTDDVFDDSDRL